MPFLSIILVTHNSASVIIECLQSILGVQQTQDPTEIIIVDNASADGTVAAIRRTFSQLTVVENKQNIGFASAANQGFSRAKGEITLFLNPDIVLHGDFAGSLMRMFRQHAEAAIIGCKLVDAQGVHQPSCWETPSLRTVVQESFLPYRLSLALTTVSPSELQEVEMVSGACIGVRREVFERLHGFDERFFMYYEDADLCLRARQEGDRVFFSPEATAMHRVRESYGGDLTNFFLHVYTSKIIFFEKHRSRTVKRIAEAIVVCGILLRIPAYALVGVLTFDKKLLRLSKYHTFVLSRILKEKSAQHG